MHFTFGRRMAVIATSALLTMLLFPADSRAQLLEVPPPTHPSLLPVGSWTYGYPFIELTVSTVGPNHPEWTQGRTTYDGTFLTVETFPQWITFATAPYWYQAVSVGQASDNPLSVSPCGVPDEGGDPNPPIECGTVVLKMMLDSYTGALVGGTDTDLVFRGHVVLDHWECDDSSPFVPPVFPEDPPVCGGGPHHSVVDLDANGTLLTGRVVEAGSEYVDGTTARLNFNVRITGGLLTAAGLGANKFDKNAFQLGVDIISSNFTGSFAQGAASGQAQGVAGALPLTSALICTGLVGGKVWNDVNRNGLLDAGEAGVTGAAVTLSHTGQTPKLATSDANGRYGFPYVCDGDNQIDITPPTGYAAVGSSSVIVNVPSGGVVSNLNFGIYQVPVGSFTSYKQAAWGAKPKVSTEGEPNAAKILADNFDAVYPGGEVVVGIPDTLNRYSITLTGAAVIQTFLPQGQKNIVLTKSYVDPLSLWKLKHKGKYQHHRMISGFAGDVLALQLNVDFSSAGVTRWGLGQLRVVSGPLAGNTVNEILALANRVLGGDPLPAGLTLQDLDTVLEKINRNFESGAQDRGYLN